MGEVQAARLRQAREYIGFTRDQVAGRCGWLPGLLGQLEDGTVKPDPVQLEKLSRLYRRPLPWFTGEFKFEPGLTLLCRAENLTPGDREAVGTGGAAGQRARGCSRPQTKQRQRRGVPVSEPIVHLSAGDTTACGRWAKRCTSSAAGVTCPACNETWDYAAAQRQALEALAKGGDGGR